MLKWLMKQQINARDILAADMAAFWKFTRVSGLTQYRKDIPRDVIYAAKLAGKLAEDCGPCTQLVVTMAEREGVAADVLRLVSLAFAITAARIFSTVKYALGYGQACRRVVVGGSPVATLRQAA
jgi:hypothetical protein